MVNMDTRLPLLVQQPDIVNALATGTRAAADQANVLRAAEGQNIFRQHGAGAMQGNANALAAIAGYDPQIAQGIQATNLDMDATRLNMDVSRARIQQIKSETARALAAANDQAQAQREAQEAIRLSNDAFLAWKRGDTARWSQITGLMGASDVPMDEEGVAIVGAIAAGASAFEAARGARPEPDYTTIDGQLIDRNAPGGPAVVQVAGMGGGAGGGNPDVQSSEILPDGSGAMMVLKNNEIVVRDAAGTILTGDDARRFVERSYDNYNQLQRELNAARRTGQNEAEAATGAAAAAAGERGQQGIKLGAEFFQDARTVRSNIRNIESAIRAIDEGAKSGVVYNMLPNVTVASASLANAMQRMGLDVIGSVTFGALSEGEMRLAMDTAVPQGLEAPELRVWLERKLEAQRKALEGIEEAIIHFDNGGTMAEWTEKMRALPQSAGGQGEDPPPPPPPTTGSRYPDFETFAASPVIQNAAKAANVTVEGMWQQYLRNQQGQ